MGNIFNGVMRVVSSLIGLLMIALGGIWILQGLNIAFLESFMANDKRWAFYGLILLFVGFCQLMWSNIRQR